MNAKTKQNPSQQDPARHWYKHSRRLARRAKHAAQGR